MSELALHAIAGRQVDHASLKERLEDAAAKDRLQVASMLLCAGALHPIAEAAKALDLLVSLASTDAETMAVIVASPRFSDVLRRPALAKCAWRSLPLKVTHVTSQTS